MKKNRLTIVNAYFPNFTSGLAYIVPFTIEVFPFNVWLFQGQRCIRDLNYFVQKTT